MAETRGFLGALTGAVRLVWRAAPREVAVALGLQAVVAAGVAATFFVGKVVVEDVVDAERRGTTIGDLVPELLALGAVAMVASVALVAIAERQRLLAELVERHVQGSLIDAVSSVELLAFESASFHDRYERAATHAVEQSWRVTYAFVSMATSTSALVATTAVLVGVAPLLLPVLALAYVPVAIAAGRNSRTSYTVAYEQTPAERERAYLGRVLTDAAEAKEIRLFGSGQVLRERYESFWDRRLEVLRGAATQRARRALGAGAVATALVVLGVAYLAQLATSGRIDPAAAGIGAIALQQVGARLRTLSSTGASLRESALFLQDVLGFLDDPLGAPASTGPKVPGTPDPAVLDVDNVRFTYPGTDLEVLRGVTLRVAPGEVVALVGGNGSGKTTLAKIVCGLYPPTAGAVRWWRDGEAIDAPVVSALFQDFVRYELSGHDNVALGEPARIDDVAGVREAASAIGAHVLLEGLPEGYGTRLSRAYEGGVDLSVGEWQRVALARALFRRCSLVVLDEPSAALDPRAEEELTRVLRAASARRGVLLISHRLSTVVSADRIHVLEAGRIVETGDHAELIGAGGRYAELFHGSEQSATRVEDR